MAFSEAWMSVLREERAKVPAGSPFRDYQEATRRASARYRGGRAQPRSTGRRRNPSGGSSNAMVIAGIALAVLLGPQLLAGLQAPPPAPPAKQ